MHERREPQQHKPELPISGRRRAPRMWLLGLGGRLFGKGAKENEEGSETDIEWRNKNK